MLSMLRPNWPILCCALAAHISLAQAGQSRYGLRYELALHPAEDRANVAIDLDERIDGNLRWLRFHIDPERHQDFDGDGTIESDGDYLTWTPPRSGGRLTFSVVVSHRRRSGRYDARMTDDWALFRGDDIFPPAETRDREEAEADATLKVHVPSGWSFITAYPKNGDELFEIEHAHRRLDRPTGWMIAGHLGVRRERIAGIRVIVAGPLQQGVRRMDLLAHLNWNLPRIKRLIPDMPKELLVVSAGDDMWRGGLSGPNSLYLHADRPLISENGTSTLVHELVHVATGIKAERGGDWIVEGVAEYYSLKLMWRSRTITTRRYHQAFRSLEKWAQEAGRLDAERSRGPITAKAVGVLRELDREIYQKTEHNKSLDDVVRLLVSARQKVSCDSLRQAVIEVMGQAAETLTDEHLGLTSTE